jgi:hypothetical protein
MLKDTSQLSLKWLVEDTWTSLETKWLSREEMGLTHKNGTLIKDLKPLSQLLSETCHGTSRVQESQEIL